MTSYSEFNKQYPLNHRFVFHGQANTQQSTRSSPSINTMRIKSVSIPNTFYNIINGYNNTILFNEGGGQLTATLTPGFYATTGALATEIKTALEAVGAGTYTVTYSSTTKLYTISIAAGNFEFEFANGTFAQQEITATIGFTKTNTGVAASHTGTRAVILTPWEAFYFSIPELGSAQQTTGNFSVNKMLALFPINEQYNEMTNFEINNTFEEILYIQKKSLSLITPNFYILDSINQLHIIDFLGAPVRIYIEYSEY